MAGTAQGITDDVFLTYICLSASESVDTKVIRIIGASLVSGVLDPIHLISLEMVVGFLRRNLDMSFRERPSFKEHFM